MRRRLLGPFAAATLVLLLVAPVSAHGDHDARPLARGVAAGPYVISLWQVYPDSGTAMTPHLIVMFDGAAAPSGAAVDVVVNSVRSTVIPSTTTANAWETTEGVAEGDAVAVTITDGAQSWSLDPVVVPPPPTSMLPMQELIWVSIALTAGAALWVASRTARTWRRPAVIAS
jgi:hypothetical protein